jgi:tripartite-type tricarboxylate transporter receptor subunit TctC
MSQNKMSLVYCVLVLTIILLLAGWVNQVQAAEKYPNRAINLICPFTAGGSTDLAARAVSLHLSKKWGVAMNVINKPGGNGVPALLEVYNSSPDGYTMLADGQPFSTFLGFIVKDLPFKIMDRTFIAVTTQLPGVLMVASNSPYKTMADVAADAKKDPGNFTWACLGGTGGTDYLSRQFFKAIGVDVQKTQPIMAKGGSAAAALAAGGHAKVAFASVMSAAPFLQEGGTARALLLTWHERDEQLPNVPSATELGYPELALPFWCGVSAPPKTPSYVVSVWDKTMKEIQKDPEYLSLLKKTGFRQFYLDSKEMREFVTKDIAKAAEVYATK